MIEKFRGNLEKLMTEGKKIKECTKLKVNFPYHFPSIACHPAFLYVFTQCSKLVKFYVPR